MSSKDDVIHGQKTLQENIKIGAKKTFERQKLGTRKTKMLECSHGSNESHESSLGHAEQS